MRVVVIFFGMVRRGDLTIDNIRRKIYAFNKERGVEFYTIASLSLADVITNPRNDERRVAINKTDALLLDADYYALVRENRSLIAAPLAAAMLQPDYYENDWISIRNVLYQWASLERAWDVCMQPWVGQFDYVLFLRPDLIYLDQLNIRRLVSNFSGTNNIAVPTWASWGGFNDRVALADPEAARHYVARLSLVAEYCAGKLLHPETMLAYVLHKGGCKVGELPVRARRVRANGSVMDEDFGESTLPLGPTPQPFALVG